MTLKIAPSILSADFSRLGKEIKEVESSGADMIHIDVMDGHFVPNLTIGPAVVKYIRKVTKLPLDVHLMIDNPLKYTDRFLQSGSDMLTLHIETITPAAFKKEASRLRKLGVRVGVSLNPATPLNKIKGILSHSDFVLVMTVNPGFGGQAFISGVLPKIKELRSLFSGDIAIDGGINDQTAKQVVACGANVLAAGSYIFGAKNKKKAIERLKNAGKINN
ncbi:MAG: ribulose-phosphate 3-epimerase [Candidatus Omnitrophica bacterium]|nr:ribulose-phosphate 3-epimerase [Candidatus Omnitrophota bacterium]